MGQVIGSLVQNAADHAFTNTPDPNIDVTAELSQGTVVISVRDNGIGMSPYVVAHAFDPMFTTTLGKSGGGLGLPVCRRIVTGILGGRIEIDSAHGNGTTLRVTFPQQAPGRF